MARKQSRSTRAKTGTRRSSSSRAAPSRRRRKAPSEPLLTRERTITLLGVMLVLAGVLTALAMLPSPEPSVIQPWLDVLRALFGLTVPVVPLLMIVGGLMLVVRERVTVPQGTWQRATGALFFLIALLSLISFAAQRTSVARARDLGGALGYWLSMGAVQSVGRLAAPLVMFLILVIGVMLLFNLTVQEVATAIGLRRKRSDRQPQINGWAAPPADTSEPSAAHQAALRLAEALGTARGGLETLVSHFRPVAPVPEGAAPATPRAVPPAPVEPAEPPRHQSPHWTLPPWQEMLEEGDESALNMEDIRTKTHIIEETLSHFGVPARVVEVNRGPTVTQYGVEPGYLTRTVRGKERTLKVKVSAITSLHNDLALALAVQSIRIEAPVPGHTFVGIEVPNDQSAAVTLAGTMTSEDFGATRGVLKVALGRDVMGNTLVADLTRMPHLLIAGATGAGKSVCINSIIACLLCTHTPDQLKLMMVDPKMVELVGYNGIPHLIVPVVTDLERVIGLLRWTVSEMERRYKLFSQHHIRNIAAWNQRALKHDEPPLPYLVLVIDELADLMMSAADQVEAMICRLAQMARAVGIHLILATQRPSVDVVTGLIKANVPSRISFAVASQIDSRVILDRPGAESLLGRGDMLYQAADSASPRRAQGCFVSDREIERITGFWIQQAATDQPKPAPATETPGESKVASGMAPVSWESLLADEEEELEDELLPKAREIVEAAGSGSVSLLQRRLRVGYARAARLMDLLEEEGTVGPALGPGKVRPVQSDGPEPGSDDDPGFDPGWIEEEQE